MGTDKRARQKANRQAKLEAEQAETKAETRERTTRRVGIWVAIAAAIIGIVVLFSLLRGGGDDSTTISLTPTPGPEEVTAPAELASEIPDDFVPFSGTGALAGVEPAARAFSYDAAPEMTIDTSASYGAAIATDIGTIRLELFADEAPLAVNNFVNLARDGYYDGTTFHRVIDGFMAQGGDALGSGTGDPGYAFADEVDTGRAFDSVGLLAMANSGPDTNGSQFFITFSAEGTAHLTGLHTIFGQVIGDPAILDEIVRTGDGPATVVNSIRIAES